MPFLVLVWCQAGRVSSHVIGHVSGHVSGSALTYLIFVHSPEIETHSVSHRRGMK
jgi:hypothetical protein